MRVVPNFQQHCSGYDGCGSYTISYQFPGGTQTDRNLRPGERYNGTSRCTYLPITDEGDEALELLKSAFRQGHLFRVGDSITTRAKNQTVWAGIHQKTALGGGVTQHGWPDPGYFGRLRNECAASGVFSSEFLRTAEADRKKWRLDRQLSDERRKASGESGDDDATDKSPDSKATADDTSTARIEAIDAELAKIAKTLADAMRSGDRKKIMSAMRERQRLMAEKSALTP